MKLCILSALNADSGTVDICANPPDSDVFVRARDVVTGEIDPSTKIVVAVARGKPAVFVAGNHEWAGGPPEVVAYNRHEASERHGVDWLENERVKNGGVRFAGVTLWAEDDARLTAEKMALLLNSKRPPWS